MGSTANETTAKLSKFVCIQKLQGYKIVLETDQSLELDFDYSMYVADTNSDDEEKFASAVQYYLCKDQKMPQPWNKTAIKWGAHCRKKKIIKPKITGPLGHGLAGLIILIILILIVIGCPLYLYSDNIKACCGIESKEENKEEIDTEIEEGLRGAGKDSEGDGSGSGKDNDSDESVKIIDSKKDSSVDSGEANGDDGEDNEDNNSDDSTKST